MKTTVTPPTIDRTSRQIFCLQTLSRRLDSFSNEQRNVFALLLGNHCRVKCEGLKADTLEDLAHFRFIEAAPMRYRGMVLFSRERVERVSLSRISSVLAVGIISTMAVAVSLAGTMAVTMTVAMAKTMMDLYFPATLRLEVVNDK